MKPAEKIEQQAAVWVVRMERGLTAAEQDAFFDWLAADPRHGDDLNAQRASWGRLDLLGDWRPEHGPQPNRDILAPKPRRTVSTRRARTVAVLVGSIAAVIAVGIFWTRREMPDGDLVPAVPPTIALIEQRTLPDGSKVSLNRGASILVRFSPGVRRVELLRGEAHFEVAKDADRPFVVSSAGVAVRAIGTAFNVRRDPAAVEILVTEGRVGVGRLDPNAVGPVPDLPLHLGANESTLISLNPAAPDPQTTKVPPAEIDARLAWQPRLLEFTEAPLSAIVAEFNRCNAPIHLEFADPSLEREILNTAIRSDNVEGFVRLLADGLGIQAQRSGDTITLRPGRRP